MEGQRRQLIFPDECHEQVRDMVGPEGAAVLVGEYIACVVIGVAQLFPIVSLAVLLPTEGIRQIVRNVKNPAGGFRLWLFGNDELSRCRADRADLQGPGLEADAVLFQAQDLLTPQPQVTGQLDEDLQSGPFCGLKEPLQVFFGVKVNGGGTVLGRLHPLGGIAEDQVLIDSLLEDQIDQVVMLPGGVPAQLFFLNEHGIVALQMLGSEGL